MLTIWGRISSINVRKVVWAAQELGLTMQRTDAGGQFGIVKEADYRSKNPNSLVPLMEDGEVRIWESNVIVRYLCAKHSQGDFYPAGLPERFAQCRKRALTTAIALGVAAHRRYEHAIGFADQARLRAGARFRITVRARASACAPISAGTCSVRAALLRAHRAGSAARAAAGSTASHTSARAAAACTARAAAAGATRLCALAAAGERLIRARREPRARDRQHHPKE
jgi:glutathione S-transferase